MAVRIAGTCRRDRHLRPGRVHECLRRRRPAAVMSDLEQIDVREAVREE
jgi:hypothetical protein